MSLSIQRELTEKTKPPRALFLRWPYGHPLGEPFNVAQQRWVLLDTLRALEEMHTPGTIQDLPYQWRRGGPWEESAKGKVQNVKLGTEDNEELKIKNEELGTEKR